MSQLSLDGHGDDDGTAASLIPEHPTLEKLREAADGCKACPLWETGTQTVFGEGSPDADVVFVGEQPGDREAYFAESVRRWAAQLGITPADTAPAARKPTRPLEPA